MVRHVVAETGKNKTSFSGHGSLVVSEASVLHKCFFKKRRQAHQIAPLIVVSCRRRVSEEFVVFIYVVVQPVIHRHQHLLPLAEHFEVEQAFRVIDRRSDFTRELGSSRKSCQSGRHSTISHIPLAKVVDLQIFVFNFVRLSCF